MPVESKPEPFRFGELNVDRVRRILANDLSPEPARPPGRPPELCEGCSHRVVFQAFRDMDLIVAGDIGCYALGVLPPYSAMDCCVCMGSSIGIGLGLRHVLPEAEARRVVSVIGDSTFVHSGITGLAEMVYNPPRTGHVVVILDNGTTAMTGHQEHPGTGRSLNHQPTGRVVYEEVARAMGIRHVRVIALGKDSAEIAAALKETLAIERAFRDRGPPPLRAGRQTYSRIRQVRHRPQSGGSIHMKPVTNVVLAGLGGQGVIKASDVLSEAAFAAGYDVKKSELHGMSQRGGSVCSDVRFGPTVLSPMVPPGQADFLVVLAPDQVQVEPRPTPRRRCPHLARDGGRGPPRQPQEPECRFAGPAQPAPRHPGRSLGRPPSVPCSRRRFTPSTSRRLPTDDPSPRNSNSQPI